MEDTLKALAPLAWDIEIVPWLHVALALLVGLLCGASALIRRVIRARDGRLADDLIAANKARWRADDGKPMDHADWRRIDRAGERRWQEALKAQRRTRKPSDTADLVVFRGRR